jgi:hypothetical protein
MVEGLSTDQRIVLVKPLVCISHGLLSGQIGSSSRSLVGALGGGGGDHRLKGKMAVQQAALLGEGGVDLGR